ncbi:TPM domain-containing protein [Streptomyces sp. NBC_01500]|uniref:TPM domain-containing protein n=1 Tax=Streptomyces sp. NBC_01500 TaxID=2903886 RepID=UPI00224D0157|nr:TPM domain-containing protein [Streptomyces sp. NBC_01500]MCX4548468.1 TPM domain-containing protein [Streptomyces sp. NBC_01500]
MTPPEISARPHRAALAAALTAVCLLAAAVPTAVAADPPALSPAGPPVPAGAVTPGRADLGSGTTDMGTGALLVPLIVVIVIGGLAIYAYTRRRQRAETRTTPGSGAQQQGWGGGPAAVPLSQLDAEAGQLLVGTDDAVRTSTEELGVAAAGFGEEAARPFTAALSYAQSELATAFRLRQQLDDAPPRPPQGGPAEGDTERRRLLEEIVERCAEANRRLDEEAEDFDRLRALERNAPQALAAAETAFRETAGRTGAAGATLAGLRQRYADSATAAVAGNVEQAKDRLLFATSALDTARQATDTGDNAKAAVYVRAAEGAVGQATVLVGAVDRTARETSGAEAALAGALADTGTDLSEAHGLLGDTAAGTSTADLRGCIARAESAVADVRREQAGRYDPIDALRRIAEAGAGLDEALAGVGDREAGTRRAADLLAPATLAARSTVAAAADRITTNRGAVGSRARTRLAEAERHLAESHALAPQDARAALAEVQQADSLAGDAQHLAEQDVREYGVRYGGGTGGGRGDGTGGALLGGIVLGGRLGAGRGFGSGPGSFGGGGTRGRRGGGRF